MEETLSKAIENDFQDWAKNKSALEARTERNDKSSMGPCFYCVKGSALNHKI